LQQLQHLLTVRSKITGRPFQPSADAATASGFGDDRPVEPRIHYQSANKYS